MSPEGAEPAGPPILQPATIRLLLALRGVFHPTSPTCHNGRVHRCGTGRGSIGEASLE